MALYVQNFTFKINKIISTFFNLEMMFHVENIRKNTHVINLIKNLFLGIPESGKNLPTIHCGHQSYGQGMNNNLMSW